MKRLAFLPLLALAACESSDEETRVPPVTQAEAEALEDAAAMLDEQRLQVQEAEGEAEESERENP